MYCWLLPEFHLTRVLRRILTEVSYCGALLKLWITLYLNPAGSEENLRVKRKEARYKCQSYYVQLPSAGVPPDWSTT